MDKEKMDFIPDIQQDKSGEYCPKSIRSGRCNATSQQPGHRPNGKAKNDNGYKGIFLLPQDLFFGYRLIFNSFRPSCILQFFTGPKKKASQSPIQNQKIKETDTPKAEIRPI
jgi:hypothetical protein